MPRRRTLVMAAVIVIALSATLLAGSSRATVDYARQTGQPCPVCHERNEGGGALTATGAAFARAGHQWPLPQDVKPENATPVRIPRALRLLVGYIHLTTMLAWFGTIFYVHMLVGPKQLTSGLPKMEKRVAWIAIPIMAVTGTVLTLYRYQETGALFRGTWGVVFALKLAQYVLMVILAAVVSVVLDKRLRSAREPAAGPPADGLFTATSLSGHDGKEGRKALVAFHGKVYDVTGSRLWRDGTHMRRHSAGQDLSAAMEGAPHGSEVLEGMLVAGELGAEVSPVPSTPAMAHRTLVNIAHVNLLLAAGILFCVAWWKWGFPIRQVPATPGVTDISGLSPESLQCMACHQENGILTAQIEEWEHSRHAANQVGCYDCHQAAEDDVDAMAHNGYTVSTLVTPTDCARCHIRETEQFASSRHAQGGDILDSLDNVLGEQVEGVAAAVLGCQQCHGAVVEVDDKGAPIAASWPNTGIGRINPDGSRGACSTCHTRHLFSVAVGREPSSCGNCHMGPDHPQKEIYEESKHGVAFLANRERMDLSAKPWVLGEDYSAAPTCATCHMSALPGTVVNHDVGLRIAWTLRPEISTRLENWEERRSSMQQVCQSCHSPGFYNNFFEQYDDAVELYNEKFAKPAIEIMTHLRAAGKLTTQQFDEPIEWTFFYLWHHEGRRARHGAAMMGPDYVQWHGFFEVAERFYIDLVHEAEELLPGVTDQVLQAEAHQWLRAGTD